MPDLVADWLPAVPGLVADWLPVVLRAAGLLMMLALLTMLVWWLTGAWAAHGSLPGPKPVYPIIGSLHLLPSDHVEFLKTYVRFAKQFPGFFYLRLLGTDYAIINSPEGAAEILTSSEHLEKGRDYSSLVPWLGDGLVMTKGAKWQKRRKALTPAFHFNILDNFMDVIIEHANALASRLRDTNGQKVDLFSYISKTTLNVICETIMGVKMDEGNEEQHKYLNAVHEISEVSFTRFLKPYLYYEAIFRWTSYYRTQEKALKVLHSFTDSVIEARRRMLQEADLTSPEQVMEHQGHRLAFLDILLFSSIDGEPLSNIDIREEVDTFMFAGHDTTSSAISWTLYNLGRHPDVQQRAYAEVDAVLGQDRPLTRNVLAELKYLDQVLKESLRLFAPVPFIQRRLTSSIVIDGHEIPQSFMAVLFIYAIHRDPRHWPDPERFDPDRFSPEALQGRHPFSYVPFSAGPRNCIGQKLAMLELKMVVATVLKNFHITSHVKFDDLKLNTDVVLRHEGSLWLSFKPRGE